MRITLSQHEDTKRQISRLLREASEKLSAARDYLGDLTAPTDSTSTRARDAKRQLSDMRSAIRDVADAVQGIAPIPGDDMPPAGDSSPGERAAYEASLRAERAERRAGACRSCGGVSAHQAGCPRG